MKITTIESMKDFESVIKEIGKRQEALAEEKKEIEKLVETASSYAVKNEIMEGSAGDFDFKLTGAPRALKKDANMNIEKIMELLESKPETSIYVFKGVDTAGLKKAFGKNAKSRKEVEKYGYYFTEPELNKLKVERKED